MPFSSMAEVAAWRPLGMQRVSSAQSIRHLDRFEAQGAPGSRQPRSVGLAQVGQRELFETDRMGLPAWGDWTCPGVNPDQHVGLRLSALGVDNILSFGVRVGFTCRTGQHAMTGDQVV